MYPSQRDVLPDRRKCISQKVKVAGQTVHYSVGLYPDGRPGELFIEVAKAGAALRNWAGEAGMMFSIALQHGTPLDTVLNLFIGTRCEPCGEVTGHPCIKRCLSIMDLIARDLAITFLHRNDLADLTPSESLIIESYRDVQGAARGLYEGSQSDLSGVRGVESDSVPGSLSDLREEQSTRSTGQTQTRYMERGTG